MGTGWRIGAIIDISDNCIYMEVENVVRAIKYCLSLFVGGLLVLLSMVGIFTGAQGSIM